ncbi:hypothetical protein [Dyadobacter sp. LHD-138]|uniref:hypothetical protein n=1 Tax=Dyadobacter sp. LHD-138 TaxID=3071413 RepID=UPI0027E1DC5B|nr:hypothetical protein [Dyadobacter sp. LHD-138]MDQ6482411.1 hypothetical protein [Dyadobacter sp. LHD-138]
MNNDMQNTITSFGGNNAYFVKFSPKEDITAFELSRLIDFISTVKEYSNRVPKEKFDNDFTKIKDLERHFAIRDLDE